MEAEPQKEPTTIVDEALGPPLGEDKAEASENNDGSGLPGDDLIDSAVADGILKLNPPVENNDKHEHAVIADPLPKGGSPWATAVKKVMDEWGRLLLEDKRIELLKNRTLDKPELSSKDTTLKSRTDGSTTTNFPIRWTGPQTLFLESERFGHFAEPAAFALKVWKQVPTWMKLLVRRYTIEDGVILIQPVSLSPVLEEQMGVKNIFAKFSKGKKKNDKKRRGKLAQMSARDFNAALTKKGGAGAEYMVLFEGNEEPEPVKGEDIELVDPNQWFIDLREAPDTDILHEIVHEEMLAKERRNDDLRSANKRKLSLTGTSAQLEFLEDQDYITTSGTVKDGLTTSEMNKHIVEYERLEDNIEAADQKDKGNAKQEQFDYYVEEIWPTIQADFLRDPSEARLIKAKPGTGGLQPLPDAGVYAGLMCMLPSGALVESTALSVSYFMRHNKYLELALFFQGGKSALPSSDSPLAGRVFVKGAGRYHQRRGTLAGMTSEHFDKALRQSDGRKAEYRVHLDDGQDPVHIKGEDLELQRIPKALQALQLLVGLDDAAIEKSVELYWHKTKKKAIMRGQLIEDEMNKQHYKGHYKQVVDLLNSWKSKTTNLGKRCAVDITAGKKSINSCISLAASNVSNVDFYYVDYKGKYNTRVHRPMFGQSFLAHLPHSELGAGSTYLKKGKEFFKEHVYDQAAANFKLSRDGQATELETLTVDVYIALAECYDAWDVLDLPKARGKLRSLRKKVETMKKVPTGDETLTRMFGGEVQQGASRLLPLPGKLKRQGSNLSVSSVDSNDTRSPSEVAAEADPFAIISYHEEALDSLMQWIVDENEDVKMDTLAKPAVARQPSLDSGFEKLRPGSGDKHKPTMDREVLKRKAGGELWTKAQRKKKPSLLMRLRHPNSGQDLAQCRSFFHVAFLFLEGSKRMQRRGKYDGASLFLYRLLEWIEQYRLAAHHGIFADVKEPSPSKGKGPKRETPSGGFVPPAYEQFVHETEDSFHGLGEVQTYKDPNKVDRGKFIWKTSKSGNWLKQRLEVVGSTTKGKRPREDLETLIVKQRAQEKNVKDTKRLTAAASKLRGVKAKREEGNPHMKQLDRKLGEEERQLKQLNIALETAKTEADERQIDQFVNDCK
jgi:hypothetical protein